MDPGAYPAGRAVSRKIEGYFQRRAEDSGSPADQLALLPDSATIEAVIDAAFWASLRREEGYVPKISLALLSPAQTTHPLIFARALPLDPGALTRVAPAVERPGIHLGVWRNGAGLQVWGTSREIPPLCFVLEVFAPGLLVVKHHSRDEVGKFVNVAVLEGDRVKLVDEHASRLPDCPAMLSSLLGLQSPASWGAQVNVLVQLAVSMRGHGRGGALLIVPAGTETWRESIVHPLSYAVSPPFTELAQAALAGERETDPRVWQDRLARTVEALAGLTAVDGAVVMTDRYELLGFGAKIGRRPGSPRIEQVTLTEPIEGGGAEVVHPVELGGTRHLSAAQFVHDQHDTVALVASQDGRFTVFDWSPCEEMVHAHRIEMLLL
jgi:hypothetical protein